MVSDQEIAKGVESVLRQSDPNAVNSLNGVVQQVEAKLGLDLSHKAGFIRDQINFLLRSHPQQPQPQPPQQQQQQPPQQQQQPPRDHFALHNHPQFQSTHHHQHQQHQQQLQQQQHHQQHHHQQQQQQQQQFTSHFALQAAHPHVRPHHQPLLPPQPQPPAQLIKPEAFAQNATPHTPKESAPVGAKRRGGPGGLNKVCGVSPELQAIVGEPALPRTEIVKQLWAYIRKNNLQDPSNKRKIICDDALRVVFETDCTDMFKMNKLLAKHIIALEPTKESSQAKRLKVDVESTTESVQRGSSPVVISEALAKFLGTGGREMPQSEAITRVWEYIKVNRLEDPLNSMVILCDAKLRDLLGCESISALGIPEMITRHHLFNQS
ncbi:hormone receptor 4 [Quercus lobata]|uniref:DM2 domain-containing protein n=1 Tax=Quercus lobata TaxID=97700 RepID=A0A7N2LTW3_QUELO|nr:hormone receptor 4 [Quercus lobata]